MKNIDYITEYKDTAAVQISNKFNPTKQMHNYMPLYHRHFHNVREEVKLVVEIGVQTGRSLKVWKEYFPNATIYGIDIDPECKKHEEDRIKIIIGSQYDENVLDQLPDNLDIVIDDGSHITEHQIMSFEYLFTHKMANRGIYVCEDIGFRDKTINYFKNLANLVNFVPPNFLGSNWPNLNSLNEYSDNYYVNNILGVSIYRFIAFIDKGINPEDGQAFTRLK